MEQYYSTALTYIGLYLRPILLRTRSSSSQLAPLPFVVGKGQPLLHPHPWAKLLGRIGEGEP